MASDAEKLIGRIDEKLSRLRGLVCHMTWLRCTCTAPQFCRPVQKSSQRDIDPVVILDPDGFFRAIDRSTYDVDCDQDGFFSTSSEGYGRTPLDAIVDLLDNIGSRTVRSAQ